MNLGLIFPCLMGSRMLGSTLFPWLIGGLSSFRTEDCLVYAFIVLGLVVSIIAYDYQVKLSYFECVEYNQLFCFEIFRSLNLSFIIDV